MVTVKRKRGRPRKAALPPFKEVRDDKKKILTGKDATAARIAVSEGVEVSNNVPFFPGLFVFHKRGVIEYAGEILKTKMPGNESAVYYVDARTYYDLLRVSELGIRSILFVEDAGRIIQLPFKPPIPRFIIKDGATYAEFSVRDFRPLKLT